MDIGQLEAALAGGENVSLEFKRCGNQPGRDVYETICSFANRQGGSILLGVLDDGTIEGIPDERLTATERTIANAVNNPDLFSPAPAVESERIDLGDGRSVLRLWVPMGPSLYRFKGDVFDRIFDADVKLRSDAQINAIYLRKQNYYTEQRVIPWLTMDDLRSDLFFRVREMIAANRQDHPWLELNDDELLDAARLRARDRQTGEHGLTLAAAVLLGTDETILDILPAYRTDAVLRRVDVDRYDDRAVVKTNLIEAYDQLVEFCRKWMPDSFALDGDRRISVRDIIVRELVVNSLIHREYSSPYIALIEIDAEGIRTRNASRSLYTGPITPEHLDATPKNPVIANFFMQIGLSEELGSGTRNLYRCSRLYTGDDPVLQDGDFFDAFVPVPVVYAAQVEVAVESGDASTASVAEKAPELDERILGFLAERGAMGSGAISEVLDVPRRSVQRHLSKLVEGGRLKKTGSGRGTLYELP